MAARIELDSHWNLGRTPQKTATVSPGTDPELSLSPLKCLPGSQPKLLPGRLSELKFWFECLNIEIMG